MTENFTKQELEIIQQFCDIAVRQQGINVAEIAVMIAKKAQLNLNSLQEMGAIVKAPMED